MKGRTPADTFHPLTIAQWRAWLQKNHATSSGVWLVSYKKDTGQPRVDYEAAVTEAICFGWIDSKPRTLDEARSMLWFAPRKPGSGWSRKNKERAERAIATKRMTPAGARKIAAARKDGSWNALDAVERLEVPPDLAEALSGHAGAATHFDAFPRSVKRSILEWIGNAKTSPTRLRRIEETARLAAKNIRANQWRP